MMSFYKKKIPYLAYIVHSFVFLSACEPISCALVGTAVVAPNATREKGVSGAMGDSAISLQIKKKVYSLSPRLYSLVSFNVQNGDILLAGKIETQEESAQIEGLAWQIDGVKNVYNNLEVAEELGLGTIIKDSAVTTSLKSQVLCTSDVRSLNYSFKTVDGVVYIMGTAQSQEELDKVLDISKKTKNVKKVVNYVYIKGETCP
jgi:osmotically-inducible protein OsmY